MSDDVFIARFTAAPEGGFVVSFPDAPGVLTEGDTFAAALAAATEALSVHLEAGGQAGADRDTEAAVAAILAEGALPVPIEAEIAAKTVRINVSFDDRLLARIDRAAEERGQSRSGLLAEAARAYIVRRPREAA